MANKVFRFALGSAAMPRSGVWRAWTHEDEVHLAVRAGDEDVAVTVYPTGRWRITVGAVVSRWTRPKEFRPGWSRGPDLIIPYTATPVASPLDDPCVAEPIAWLAPSDSGFVARFSLLTATPSAEASHWRPQDVLGSQNLAALPLRTAGTLHLYRVDEPAPPEQAPPPGLLGPEALRDPATERASGLARLTIVVSADQMGCPSLRESYRM
ncbi:MAG: hypothetical protein SGJ01_14050 [Gemmatimonadota bacterium]|nr:hypothetical protein [Gemmatimonadota bacterium]